jgi:hypothetical protein
MLFATVSAWYRNLKRPLPDCNYRVSVGEVSDTLRHGGTRVGERTLEKGWPSKVSMDKSLDSSAQSGIIRPVAGLERSIPQKQSIELGTCCDNPRLKWQGIAANAAIVCASCKFILSDDGQLADWHDPEQIAWEGLTENSSD